MRYEIYVDSLFLINFTMNLYLLIWVNRSTFHTATLGRMVMGAVIGALGFLITCCGFGNPFMRILIGLAMGVGAMPVFTFSVKTLRMFLKVMKQLVIYSFLMGGVLLFVIGMLPGIRRYLTSVAGILGVAGIAFWLFGNHRIGAETGNVCRVTLMRNGVQMTINALVDSGNSLTEPISGKPVCVVERGLQEELWGGDTAGIRVIPYHSIGKAKGIMMGYPLDALQISLDSMLIEVKDVYVAVSNEPISAEQGGDEIKMIINPEILKKRKGRNLRQLGEAL